MQQNNLNNSALFPTNRTRHREEATQSWRLDQPSRDAFNEAVVRETMRMAGGPGSSHKGITVGWGEHELEDAMIPPPEYLMAVVLAFILGWRGRGRWDRRESGFTEEELRLMEERLRRDDADFRQRMKDLKAIR